MQVSSYGLTAGTLPGTSDVDSAIGGKMASFQGRDPQTGENILAVSYPLFFNSRVVGVLRYVTSLREAQHRVLVESLLASALPRPPRPAISGWADTLASDPGANIDKTKRGLGIILKESRRLTTMVEELLEFTKMQDGRFTLRVESVVFYV